MKDVYVVPDNQLPRRKQYGEEIGVQSSDQMMEGTLKRIQEHRAQNPVYAPFEPGTKTLAGRKLDHDIEYDRAALALKAAGGGASGGGGSGGGGSGGLKLPGTAGERSALATAQLMQAANTRYEELKKSGYKYPLYYTLNSLMRDPNMISSAQVSGADVASVINALVRSKAEPGLRTPEAYFSSPTGSKLKESWENLLWDAKQKDDPYADLLG